MKTFEQFLDTIDEDSKVALYHDADCDGTTSAALIIQGLKRANKPLPVYVFTHKGERAFNSRIVEELNQKEITHLIVADLSMENDPLMSNFVEREQPIWVLVIDHHPTTIKLKNKHITVIKPDAFGVKEISTMCTAHLCYALFSKIVSMNDLEWLAIAGILADATYAQNKNIVHTFFEKNGINYIEGKPFKTTFARLPQLIDYARCADLNNIPRIRKALLVSKGFTDAIEALKEFQPIEEEVNKALQGYATGHEAVGIIRFYHINSKYEINSLVSTILSFEIDDKNLLIIYKEKDGKMHVSARFQPKTIDTGKLLRACIKGFENSNAGGHIPASGAGFPVQYWDEFKKRLIENVDKSEFKVQRFIHKAVHRGA